MKVLEGVTVLDFTQAYSGPFCAMQLADFGARVIKIERAGCGDQSREWTPFRNGYSGYYASINRNKESLTLDLTSSKGVNIVKALVEQSDIVLENFKYGTLDKLGLGYSVMKTWNPGLIFASLTGFGQSGPWKHLAAYDNVVQSMCGMMDQTGDPQGDPCRVGPAIGDSFTGLQACNGILMAYFHKLNTGEGQSLNVAMLDTLFGMLEEPILHKTVLGEDLTRCGSHSHSFAPYDVYPCQDGLYTLAVTTDEDFIRCCSALDHPEWAKDLRFATNSLRLAHRDQLNSLIAPLLLPHSRQVLDEIFQSAGVAGGGVLDIPEVVHSPQLEARSMVWSVDDPGLGLHNTMGNPVHMAQTPPTLTRPSPLLGQDTRAILEELGYSSSEITQLQADGIV